MQAQIGTAPNIQTGQGNEAMSPVAGMAERLYVQEAARIPYYGMRQVLYPDLTMTVALGKYNDRFIDCFEKFKNEELHFYHLPVATFQLKFDAHVIDEVRYLALIPNHNSSHDISTLWPVRNVQYLPRSDIDPSITGQKSNSDEQYILFELGKPFSFKQTVNYRPDEFGTFRHSIKITTMRQLEKNTYLSDAKSVYEKALE
ncbi:hypothetical protein [Pseudoalteromonas piscicida]|uniref:hypothetical protein n=1 Tax=Pseudoalteromonas piscicida TaxID=43662 RepID=UPI0032C019C5